MTSNLPSAPSRAVILTALSVEYQAVQSHLVDTREDIHQEGTIYERGNFLAGENVWDVSIAQIGMGNPGTAAECERAIAYIHPHVVLFVGIAGGLKDVRLGDVVVATKVYSYESGKVNTTFLPRPEVGNTTYLMEQRARYEANKPDWLQRLQQHCGLQSDPTPRAFVGPIAAGEKVLASTSALERKRLQTNYSDALAIEMEGYGFLKAVHANQRVQALVIRGISDLINNKSKSDGANFQEIAAKHASAFAFEILAKLSFSEQTRTTSSRAKIDAKTGQSTKNTQNAGKFTNHFNGNFRNFSHVDGDNHQIHINQGENR